MMLRRVINIIDRYPLTLIYFFATICSVQSLFLYFVSEDLNFVLLLQDKSFFENLKNIWVPSTEFLNQGGLFRPITSTINLIDYSIWGLNPFGYHLTNYLIHLVNIVLIYFLSLRLLSSKRISFICAVIFLIHPITLSSVFWISGRTDMVASFFYIFSLIMFCNFLMKNNMNDFFLSQLCFFCALLSKEISVTLPLLELAIIYYFTRIKKNKLNHVKLLKQLGASSVIVIGLFLLYRFIIFNQNPFLINSIYNIKGFNHLMVNLSKIIAFLIVPFGHEHFEFLVYKNKLIISVIIILLITLAIYVMYLNMHHLQIYLFLLLFIFIASLPLLKLTMRWYMYVPSIFFSIIFSYFIKDKWGANYIYKTGITLFVIGLFIGNIYNQRIWINNSQLNRKLVYGLIEHIDNSVKKKNFVILNFPVKVQRTSTFIAGYEELISLLIEDKSKMVFRPTTIVHQSKLLPTSIKYHNGSFDIHTCEESSYFLLGSNEQRLGLANNKVDEKITTSIGNIEVKKVNLDGKAIEISLRLNHAFNIDNTEFFYFNEDLEILENFSI